MALQPLSLTQLVEALAINCDGDELSHDIKDAPLAQSAILEICGSFVAFDEKTSIVTLSHYSVKEYLILETIANSPYFVDRPRASVELAAVSIYSIIHLADESKDKSSTISSYGVDCGLRHLVDCTPDGNARLVKLLLAFQNHIATHPDTYSWQLYAQLYAQLYVPPTMFQRLALCIILRFGHLSMLKCYLHHHPIRETLQDSPLAYAARYSDPPRVQHLLEKGLNVNVKGKFSDYTHYFPPALLQTSFLTAAAFNDVPEYQDALLRLFLEHGGTIPKDAIHSVLRKVEFRDDDDHPRPAVIRFLLDHGADPTTPGFGGNHCLHLATQNGRIWVSLSDNRIKIIYMLVDAGCDPTLLDGRGLSSFNYIIQYRSVPLTKWLLDRGFPLPARAILDVLSLPIFPGDGPGDNSGPGMLRMLNFLVARGVAVDTQDSHGWNALHFLALHDEYRDYESTAAVVRLLVDRGCGINQQSRNGQTPIHLLASNWGHTSLLRSVELFLSQGATLPTDIISCTMRFVEYTGTSRDEWVERFLAPLVKIYGASCQQQTPGGDNPLHRLLRSPSSVNDLTEIISFLLANGCDPQAPNSIGETPWRIAIEFGHLSIARTLLSQSPDWQRDVIQPPFRDVDGNCVLHRLCSQSSPDFMERVEFLQEVGYDFSKDVGKLNHKGFTPLCIALRTRNAHTDVVSWLLDLGEKFSDVNPLALSDLEWAWHLPWQRDATEVYERSPPHPKPTVDDVAQVYRLLLLTHHGKLSPDIARRIMDTAEYWGYTKVVTGKLTSDTREMILLPTVPSETPGWISRRIIFSCKFRVEDFSVITTAHLLLRLNTVWEVPVYLTNGHPTRTTFEVWDEYTLAQRFDREEQLALSDVRPGDLLTVDFTGGFNDTSEAEFFQVEVYYMIEPEPRSCGALA